MKKIIPALLLILFYLSSVSQNSSFNISHADTIVLSHPVFNTKYNPHNRVLYFYSRLNNANTGYFVYELDNEAVANYIKLDQPIGDLEYNPVQSHVLVSEFTNESEVGTNIRVFDAKNNYSVLSSINFSDDNYPSRMFYAPNGKIYITMNAHMDGFAPTIKVLDASTYETIQTITTGLDIELSNSNTFQSFYCYNPYDECVYITVSPYNQAHVIQPFQTSYNTNLVTNLFPFESNLEDSWIGKLIKIDKYSQVSSFDISPASEIICSDPSLLQNSSDYKGKLFINTENNLEIFDCNTNSFLDINNQELENIYDMDYCPINNTLLAYSYEQNSVYDQPDIYTIHIYRIQEDGTYDEIWNIQGLASSISYNKYDGKLYVYYLGDASLDIENGLYSKIFIIDPLEDNNLNAESIDLPNKSLLNEVKPQANYPYFDAYNKAYFPNGVHSSVSVINFEANEPLPLYFSKENDGTVVEWVSIPRMPSNTSAHYEDQQGSLVKDIFDRNNFAVPYTYLRNDYHDAQSNFDEYNEWDDSWDHHYQDKTWSYRGYVMNLDSDEDNIIYMTGNIKDASTTFPLYPQQKNWVGYFLTQEQDIFDALGASTLSLLNRIEHQDYFCVKGIAPFGPLHGVSNVATWVCEKQQTNIKYGEMVKLHSISETGLESDLIQWQNPGNLPRKKIRPDLEYFSYDETTNYTPLIIELDYEENPRELAAYLNEKCVGATSVMPEDSVVFMRAYLEGTEIDSVEFRDWYGTKSSIINSIKEYSVFNPNIGRYEKRALMSNTDDDVVRISFKSEDVAKSDNSTDNQINIWPNPAKNQLNYSVFTSKNGTMNISVFDLNGRFLKTITDKKVNSGFNIGNANIDDIKKGIYLIKIKIENITIIKKLVIN